MISQDTIRRKVKRIDDTLDRMEQGLYTGVSIRTVTDEIFWLFRFRHISCEEMNRLTDKAINVIKVYKPD